MTFKVTNGPKRNRIRTTAMFRIPHDLVEKFNRACARNNVSAQKLIEQMARHCLSGAK